MVESFTMVTQPPGALSDVHDRAPVILLLADWSRWLDPAADVDDLLSASPPDAYRIQPYANIARYLVSPFPSPLMIVSSNADAIDPVG